MSSSELRTCSKSLELTPNAQHRAQLHQVLLRVLVHAVQLRDRLLQLRELRIVDAAVRGVLLVDARELRRCASRGQRW